MSGDGCGCVARMEVLMSTGFILTIFGVTAIFSGIIGYVIGLVIGRSKPFELFDGKADV